MGTLVSSAISALSPTENVALLVWDLVITTSEQEMQPIETSCELALQGGVLEGFYFGAPPGKLYVVLGG